MMAHRDLQKNSARDVASSGRPSQGDESMAVSNVPVDLHCCFIPEDEQDETAAKGCGESAGFEILDLEDTDPYVSITHACTAHVGEMLGHADNGNWSEGDPERWEVRALVEVPS
jgi:hypothetical protein